MDVNSAMKVMHPLIKTGGYEQTQAAYKALHHPPFRKSDHDSVLLLPVTSRSSNRK
jgi:hypothetical protein